MQRTRGGFTIVEVLVVLAVGMIIFFSAVLLFAGKQGKTQFSQAMRDIESQVQSIVNDVGVSTFPEASAYSCSVQIDLGDPSLKPRPRLLDSDAATGTNTECIFLGKAIFIDANDDSNTPDVFNIYTVLGRRADGTEVITSFDEANPESITGPPSAVDLTETYSIPFRAKVVKASEDVQPSSDTYLMGFYNSLQPAGSIAQGSQSVITKGYPGINPGSKGNVKNSIRGILPSVPSKVWTICFQSGTSNETAQLIVNSSSAGVTTEVKYTICP